MAAFSFQQQNHPLFLDSVLYSNPPNSSFFPQFYPHENLQQHLGMNSMDFNTVHDSSSSRSLEQSSKVISQTNSVTTKQSPTCSSVVVESGSGEIQATQKLLISPTDKKRNYKNGSSSNSAQSKITCDQVKKKTGKKQKKSINGNIEEENKVIDQESPPTGYIHVRARRGQATDSHSLAERVRREKISERMKLLQAIVPGCDKVTGKALMLDEIINYVQSLQNQVEFLSMKLASANPMFYDFGVDLDAFMVKPQSISSLEPQMANVQQCSPTGSANAFTTPDNYPLVDSSTSASFVLQQGQLMPNIFSQGHRQVLWGAEDRRQKLIDQSTLSNNLFSFH